MTNPNEHTVFRQTHYSTYIRIVIKNEEIKAIIDEATKWKDHKDFAPSLESNLIKIREILEGQKILPENYSNFQKRYKRQINLNEAARKSLASKKQ